MDYERQIKILQERTYVLGKRLAIALMLIGLLGMTMAVMWLLLLKT